MDGFLAGMWDFLSFRTLISPVVLIGFYLLGAVIMPVGFWFWLRAQYARTRAADAKVGQHWLFANLPARVRVRLIVALLIVFVLMEVFWRMLFEFLIIYLHMAEDLQRLVQRG